ncbi:MAG TPA: hypothetical protein VM187_09130, partial [Niastella sp.]|nr:hypothetical protein [Niastella sp.]
NSIFHQSLPVFLLYANFFFIIPCLFGYNYRISYTTPSAIKKAVAASGHWLMLTVKNAKPNQAGFNRYAPATVVNGRLYIVKSENRLVL